MAGGVPILAFPALILAWIVYALFIAGIGTWCSLASRTSLRATIWTLSITVGLVLLPWVVELGIDVLAYVLGYRQQSLSGLLHTALSPLGTLSWLSSSQTAQFASVRGVTVKPHEGEWAAALLGLIAYAVAARCIWWIIRIRFGRMTGRMPV
jgi:hypothetical protein